MEVLAADDNGSVHLGRDDSASEDTSANAYIANEGAFLIF